MRALLCALVAGALLVAGCQGDPEPVSTTAPTEAPPTAEPEPTEEPTEPPVAVLTGEEPDPDAVDRPVLATKIDNAPPARPQAGMEDADILFTELVEGGTVRFIALYQSRLPELVGPVRSGREVDADLLPPYQPVFALSGAATVVNRLFDEVGLLTYEEGEIAGWSRDGSRRAPHNLYLSPEALLDAAEGAEALTEPVFTFDEAAPEGGTPTSGASLSYSTRATAVWAADGDGWLRSQDGGEHLSAAGDQLGADNVVVLRVAVSQGSRTDASGNPTVDVDVIGEGDGVALRDGEAFEITWRKDDRDAPLELVGADGEAFPLRPGRTWIELLPTDGGLDLDQPATEGS